MIRAVLVDDEPVAREYLRSLIAAHNDFEVVAECRNGIEGQASIEEHRPDVVFLDVQMPGVDGLELLGKLTPPLPNIVFVTAYDDYASHAFDLHALDYLLKPYDRDRFDQTIERVRAHLEREETAAVNRRLQALLASIDDERRPVYLERLAIKEREERILVRAEDIDWIAAESNYLRIHVGSQQHLIRYTLGRLERELDPARFARIHRSTIVNLDRVKSLSPIGHGDYRIHLRDGQELTLSRRYRELLRTILPEF